MIRSIGDLAMSFANRSTNARIRTELNTLSQELTSGRKSDLRSPLAGDMAPIALIERSLSNLAAYGTVNSETSQFLSGAQLALSHVSGQLSDLAGAAFAMDKTGNRALIANFGKEADMRFTSVVSALNTTIAGRSLFAGNDTAARPVDDPTLILDDLAAGIPPAASAQDISDSVDAYFAPGAGFETARYLGSDTPLAAVRLSPDDTVSFAVSAKSDALRSALASTAKAALLSRGALAGQISEQEKLIKTVGLDLMQSEAEVVALRGDIGVSEARLDQAQTRNEAEKTALAFARSDLIGADPFETAGRLTVVQTQLETFYTVTARLSHLNLTGYLR